MSPGPHAQRTPSRPLSALARAPWLLLPLGAALVSAVLLGTALLIHHSVREASGLLVRGTADAFAAAGFEALRDAGRTPSRETLEALLADNAPEGLRGVTVLDEAGRTVASAGAPASGPLPEAGTPLREGTRVRLMRRYPAPRGPGGDGAEARGGRGHLGPPHRLHVPPGRQRVLYEFEPLAALRLEALARGLVWVAGLASLLSLAVAAAFGSALAQRERMRAELERGRRLAALGEMSGVLAHELRNPLASLKGHAQLLHESLEGDPRLSPKAERVVGEALRLEQRMNDLLDFVRSGDLHLAPADPNAALRAAVDAVGGGVDARYLEGAAPWTLDAARLQQALENVLRNAQQASPAGGRVEAEVALEGGRLHYAVRDSGPGIPPGDEERIFEPFVTRKVRGVGLGLAVTRRIVELHGGRVRAGNRAGGGAEFRIELPRKGA